MVKVTSKEEILRCIGDGPSVSTLLLYGSWNNLSDETLRRKNETLHTIASSLLRSKTYLGFENHRVCSLWMQADLNDHTMDFCIGDQTEEDGCSKDDDVTMAPITNDAIDVHIKAPDSMPALFMIYKSNQNVDIVYVPINATELLDGYTVIFSAMENVIASFKLEPQYEDTPRSNKRSRDMSHTASKDTEQIRIFVAGDRSQVGKSSICLGLLGTLLQMNFPPSSLAYIKPATQCEKSQLVAEYCKNHGIEARPVGPLVYYRGFTRAYLNGETESSQELLEKVTEAVDSIAKDKAVVVIDGVGYPAVGSITNTDNCSVALASGYAPRQNISTVSTRIPPAVLIIGKRGVGDAVDSYNLNSSYFRTKNVPVLGAIFNRLPVDGYYSLENCKQAVKAYFEQKHISEEGERVFGFIPEVEGISNSRSETENNETDEKKSELDLAMEHAETFIKEFGKNVDVRGILDRAANLRDSLKDHNGRNIHVTHVEKKARNTDSNSNVDNTSNVQKINSSMKSIQLTRDQIEEAAKSAGAAGG
jgi:hypothetical protein